MMARLASVAALAFASLCVLSAGSSGGEACNNDVVDATSLLSVQVELHNVGKTDSAAQEDAARGALAAADATENSQSPTPSAADSRAQTLVTLVESQVNYLQIEADAMLKWARNESDTMQQELMKAEPTQPAKAKVLEQLQMPAVSAWITKSAKSYQLFQQLKTMVVTVLQEAKQVSRAQAVSTSDNVTATAAGTVDMYLLNLNQEMAGLGSLKPDEINAQIAKTSYITGTTITAGTVYVWSFNECAAHMLEAAESGLKASGADFTKLSPRLANALESVRRSSMKLQISLAEVISNPGQSSVYGLGSQDPMANMTQTTSPLQMMNPNLAGDMQGTTKKLVIGSISFLGVTVVGFFIYRYWT